VTGCSQPLTDDRTVAPLVPGVVTASTMTVAFGLLTLGVEHFWVVFVVGFGGVLPVSIGLAKRSEVERGRGAGTRASADAEDALATLRRRYARGELEDEAFERRLERLLETESLSDARATEANRRSSGPTVEE
jgi:uncharacterized membrane protein